MAEIFGNYIEMGDTREYLIISFSSGTLPVHERWRNNSLSADFLANYWGTFFPVYNSSQSGMQADTREKVQDTVSFIANELLENAVKFSYEGQEYSIRIGLYLSENELRFYVENGIASRSVKKFQNFIQEILSEDPGELYIRQLEKNAEEDAESRLGFLTLLNDYNADVAWKFETLRENPEITVVTTMVRLDVVRAQGTLIK